MFLTFCSILCSSYDVCGCFVIAVTVLYRMLEAIQRPFAVYFNRPRTHLRYVATLPCNLSVIACFPTLMFHTVV